ncbi:MarR family winged helix-turn-helix transcriptional regulator [Yinghuangia soli]|uniref:MarR family transcriptional regulator n=1 Tax=Yinghuangia soli TaxID=2908204 RepID=A0AA41PUB4_9ACTN|nr:MarR family transcriptional regulator [Yinghuangia soli]MCF2526013.1 MarR family transcriptional regulator [Yinghuangia soli]
MDHVLAQIERECMLLARHQVMVNRNAEGHPLERSAYLLISRLEDEGPMSIGQLADAFSLDTSTVNRQVAALLRGGLAERIVDPDGGLARKLRATDEGRRRLAADRERYCRGVERVVANWSDAERRELLDVLARFNRSIEDLQGNPWPRPDLAAGARTE